MTSVGGSLVVDAARTAGAWVAPARIVWDADGRLVEVVRASGRGEQPARRGFAVAGVPNVHSHSFQRLMAGRAEAAVRPAGGGVEGRRDDFWSWRESMYRVAARLGPEAMRQAARWIYTEMLAAGYTSVAEFHYLHGADGGADPEVPLAMADALLGAAGDAGIRLHLLPVAYFHGGFGGVPLAPRQRGFDLGGVDGYLRHLECVVAHAGGDGHRRVTVGVAPHSLRAVVPEEIARLVDGTRSLVPDATVHVHVAEQTAEVEGCVTAYGARPVRLLLDRLAVDERWCLVHATHMEEDEVRDLAATGAVVGLCPTTEANLGDGVFDAAAWRAAGGRLALGSDSNVCIDPAEEVRALETTQRLSTRTRCVLADEGSVAAALHEAAVAGGLAALGLSRGRTRGLEPGDPADFVVLDRDHPRLVGHAVDTVLDAWCMTSSGLGSPVRDVWVGGEQVVADGRGRVEGALERFAETVGQVFGGGA